MDLRNKKQHKGDYEGSSIVVLMMAIKDTTIHSIIQDKRIVWARLIIEICEYCKINVLESNMVTRHGSCGHMYSFGYQGVFKQIKNSTVGLYEARKRFEDERQHDVENLVGTIEEMISVEMSLASKSMSKLVAHADRLILPVLDVARKM